jgi:hypothetical protein
MKIKKYFIATIIMVFQIWCDAQTKYTISGYITEKGSKENLIGVYIVAPKLNAGTTSNTYGFYSITLPANDSLELLVSYAGYKTIKAKINLNKNINQNFEIEGTNLQEVEVIAEANKKISDEVQMSTVDLPIQQIKQLPALLGEKDVMKVIQLLPGVQKGGEGSAGVYVRGGGPDQNLILLDEAPVYNANHLFGFFSVFNGDALKSVELIKGGFPARYGGRLSSVIDLQMKDGNKEKIKGEAGIGIISSRITLEGPILKNKCSFLVSGRRTYIDALIYPFLNERNKGGYFFYDFNAKVNYILNDKNKVYLSGYFGRDKFYFKSKDAQFNASSSANLNWGNATTTARWNHLFGNRLFSNLSFIYTRYNLGISQSDKFNNDFYNSKYNSTIQDFGFKYNFDFTPSPNHYLKFGIASTLHQFVPQALVVKSSYPNENITTKPNNVNTIESGIFVEDDWKISNKLRTNIGMRLSSFNYKGTNFFYPEPRIGMRYLITKDLSVKGSYALMNQYMHLLSNTGIGLPTDLWVPATNRLKPQQSQQVALGLAKDIEKYDVTISIEGYYKWMKNIVNYKEGVSFLEVGNFDNSEAGKLSWEDKVTAGKGKSYGAELFIQKKVGKFTGWVGYTLSWIKFQFDSLNFGKEFYPRYDRRHDLSLVGMYKFNEHFNLAVTWVYGTGNAITLPLQSYNLQDNNLTPNSNSNGYFNGNFMQALNYYGDRNSFRMAAYHRLDIAFQFHKQLKRCERIFEFGLYNAYSRQNPFFYYTEYDSNRKAYRLKQVALFPIIPSFTWTYKF